MFRDLDDGLCLVHLFATLPREAGVNAALLEDSARLSKEFQAYICRTHSLRKVFLSIKGVYYQAEIQGQVITWLAPYTFAQEKPGDVDFRIMATFLEFAVTMQRFVNFKLFHDINLTYPPRLKENVEEDAGYLESLELTLAEPDAPVTQEKKKKKKKKERFLFISPSLFFAPCALIVEPFAPLKPSS
jgi:pescadillo protein